MTGRDQGVEVVAHPTARRFDFVLNGETVGFAQYDDQTQGRAFTHTEIHPEFNGRGFATQLIKEALDFTRSEGLYVLPFCPFVSEFIRIHPEYLPLVPEDLAPRFNLRRPVND